MRQAEETLQYFLYARTSLHVGAGQGVGFIDLPIAREKVTNWPFIPGSALKGVLRDHFTDRQEDGWVRKAFGFGGQKEDARAGALVFTDASIICLPVRSLAGTFAYVTSPHALRRLKRDWTDAKELAVPECKAEGAVVCPLQTVLAVKDANQAEKLILEDLDFAIQTDERAGVWAARLATAVFADDDEWAVVFQQRFVVLPDESFNFLCEHATEVNARVRIDDETGKVANGALWYEENLPQESILSGVVWCDSIAAGELAAVESMRTELCREAISIQIGGHASTGRGRAQCRFLQQGMVT